MFDRPRSIPTTILVAVLLPAFLCSAAFAQEDPAKSNQPAAWWLNRLKDPDPNVRETAVKALLWRHASEKGVVAAVGAALKDEEPKVSQTTWFELCRLGPAAKDAVPFVLEILKRDDPKLREKMGALVARIGPEAKAAAPALVEAVKLAPAGSGEDILKALVAIGPAGTPGLLQIVKDADLRGRPIRVAALEQLCSIKPAPKELATLLVDCLKDDEDKLRERAASGIGQLGTEAKSAIEPLVALIRDPTVKQPEPFLYALRGIGEAAIPALLELFRDTSLREGHLRPTALDMLCGIQPPPKDLLATLLAALDDGSIGVRERAANGLARLGPKAKSAIDKLVAAVRNPATKQPEPYLSALRGIGQPAIPALKQILDDAELRGRRIRVMALEGLCSLQPAPTDLLAILLACLKDEEPDVRSRAASALGQLGPKAKSALPTLVAAVRDTTNKDPQSLLTALRGIGEEGIAALRKIYDDPAIDGRKVRQYCLYLLLSAQPKVPGMLEVAIAGLKDREQDVREQAAGGLAPFGAQAAGAVDGILEALTDPQTERPESFLRALHALGEPGIAALRKVLGDRTLRGRGFRAAALNELCSLQPRPPDLLEILHACLTDDEPSVRGRAASGLASLGPEGKGAVATLVKAIRDPNAGNTDALFETLTNMGKEALPGLRGLAEDRSLTEELRSKALEAFGRSAPSPQEALELLSAGLRDEAKKVREAAVRSLFPPAQPNWPVFKLLKEAFGQKNAAGKAAAWTLTQIPPEGPKFLIAAVRERDPEIVMEALDALLSITPGTVEVSNAIIGAAQNTNLEVRKIAGPYLDKIVAHPPNFAVKLGELMVDPLLCLDVLKVLRKLGPEAEPAAPALEEFLKIPQGEPFRDAIQETLKVIRGR